MAVSDIAGARAVADQWLDRYYRDAGMDAVIIDDQTLAEPYGWVFFFQSARWLQTADPEHLLIGNAPIVVTHDGEVHMTGTAGPTEEFLRRFRR